VNFTPAKFNTGDNGERFIVTSTGSVVVTWAFVYRDHNLIVSDHYQMKKYSENVVADEFRYNRVGEVLVTLEHDVTVAKQKSAEGAKRGLFP
jgi:hypothetical protein